VSSPVAVFCSFRLGGTDGVSIEAAKWEWALRELGFVTRRVAGELGDGLRPDDVWIPFLAIEPAPGARLEPDVLAAALAGADLVVVENLCSLPLNETASRTAADVLAEHGGRVVFHHHDFAWERPHLAHLEGLPPRRVDSLHVTISDRARHSLEDRGFAPVVTIRNAFDLDPPEGDRAGTRAAFGFADDERVVLQPTRAIERKGVPEAIAFVEALAELLPDPVRYWITGPAEDGYGPQLEAVLDAARVPVTVGRAPHPSDAYAAADAVVFPSTWEGFGNPVVESVIARRPLAVGHYPVLDELLDLGFRFFSVHDAPTLAAWLQAPDPRPLEHNLALARAHFDLRELPTRIRRACAAIGWNKW
jgi:glycosyltransferase involved in cell wall biosynthesis